MHYGAVFQERKTLYGEEEIPEIELNEITAAAVQYQNVSIASESCEDPYVQKILQDLKQEGIASVIREYFTQ